MGMQLGKWQFRELRALLYQQNSRKGGLGLCIELVSNYQYTRIPCPFRNTPFLEFSDCWAVRPCEFVQSSLNIPLWMYSTVHSTMQKVESKITLSS